MDTPGARPTARAILCDCCCRIQRILNLIQTQINYGMLMIELSEWPDLWDRCLIAAGDSEPLDPNEIVPMDVDEHGIPYKNLNLTNQADGGADRELEPCEVCCALQYPPLLCVSVSVVCGLCLLHILFHHTG